MKLLFDFFPIILFFITYKIFGLYTATAIAMISSLAQVLLYRYQYERYEKMQLLSLAIIFILGGATLLFHNPMFIKWKPTGLYWITALVFLMSSFYMEKPLVQKIMESNIILSKERWFFLNMAWVLFFIIMGAANLYVAYYYSTDDWVNFKLFGGIGFTLVFICLQALYLTQYGLEKK